MVVGGVGVVRVAGVVDGVSVGGGVVGGVAAAVVDAVDVDVVVAVVVVGVGVVGRVVLAVALVAVIIGASGCACDVAIEAVYVVARVRSVVSLLWLLCLVWVV